MLALAETTIIDVNIVTGPVAMLCIVVVARRLDRVSGLAWCLKSNGIGMAWAVGILNRPPTQPGATGTTAVNLNVAIRFWHLAG